MGYYFNTKPKSSRKEISIAKKIIVDDEISDSKEIEGIFDDEELIHNREILDNEKLDSEKLDNVKKIPENKETFIDRKTSVRNAIFLKIGCNKTERLKKEKLKKEKLQFSKKIMLSAWNVNCGITAGNPILPPIVYENVNPNTKVVFMSTWGIKCGIATYTSYLLNNMNKCHGKEIVNIFPMNNHDDIYEIESDLIHIQHEFGIMPHKINSDSKIIITFHAVFKTPKTLLKQLESDLNIVGYIVHSKIAGKVLRMNTKKAVYTIPHGSEIIKLPYESKSLIRKELNFDKLRIRDSDKCAFVFGFQSDNKNFNRIIDACKNMGIKLIISGAKHECGFESELIKYNKNNVTFLNRFLDDNEVNMYSSACDLLIFDYVTQKHYSCSGAMHRVIGSGNPVICSRINHFSDIIENEQCLKFRDQEELELKIKEALEKNEEFSKKALEYANSTSWETVAKLHLDVYKKYVNVDDKFINDNDIIDDDNDIIDDDNDIIDNKKNVNNKESEK